MHQPAEREHGEQRHTDERYISERLCTGSFSDQADSHEPDHRERRHQSPKTAVQPGHPGRRPGPWQGHHQTLAERQHTYREPKRNHIVKIETNDSMGLDMGGALPSKPRPNG